MVALVTHHQTKNVIAGLQQKENSMNAASQYLKQTLIFFFFEHAQITWAVLKHICYYRKSPLETDTSTGL